MAKRQKKAYLQWPTNTAITCGMWIHKTKTCHTTKSEGYQRGVSNFWNCVDLAICNAYCIHKQLMLKKKEKPLTKKDFRLKLASQLIGNYNSKKRGLASFASEKHLLVPTCHQRKCFLQGCKSRVKTCCVTCKSHLCLKHNFIFHEGYEL